MTIGEAVKRSREEQGVSQEWLAEQVEVSRQAVSKWERGEAVPTPENLGRIEAALGLPAGTLAELCAGEGSENMAETVLARKVPRPLLAGLILVGLAAAFCVGFFLPHRDSGGTASEPPPDNSAPPSESVQDSVTINIRTYGRGSSTDGVDVVLPLEEDGTVCLELPLSYPGEERRLAAQLEFAQYPGYFDLEKEYLAEGFDLYAPWGDAGQYLPEEWVLEDVVSISGGEVGLAFGEDEVNGASYYILSRPGPEGAWIVLDQFPFSALVWTDGTWARDVGNVMGYEGVLVECYGGDSARFIAAVNGAPRTVFFLWYLQGFADLDLDGELEAVCRPPESDYVIYDREPAGYVKYTLSSREVYTLDHPEGYYFVFNEKDRAFGFEKGDDPILGLDDYAPVYDYLASGGYLRRREGTADTRTQGGCIGGTVVTLGSYRTDEVSGWSARGTPLPSARQQAAIALDTLEALTGQRPERCCAFGGALTLETGHDGSNRPFFILDFQEQGVFGKFYLTWYSEFTPWSPIRKDAVELPNRWAAMTREEQGLWWYGRSGDFFGTVVSTQVSPYVGVLQYGLEDGGYAEVRLDDDGFLSSIYYYPPEEA